MEAAADDDTSWARLTWNISAELRPCYPGMPDDVGTTRTKCTVLEELSSSGDENVGCSKYKQGEYNDLPQTTLQQSAAVKSLSNK